MEAENGGITLDVLKKAEKEDCLVIRVVETQGRRNSGKLHFHRPVEQVAATNLMEWTEEAVVPVNQSVAELELEPFEICTFKLYFK